MRRTLSNPRVAPPPGPACDAAPMPEPPDDIVIRLLAADESNHVVDAITAAYGTTYDVPWCYDATEITRRIAHGQLVSPSRVNARRRPALPRRAHPSRPRRPCGARRAGGEPA